VPDPDPHARDLEARRAALPTPTYPEGLPIVDRRDDLLAAIDGHQVVVVAGETGSGKSTQLPKLCLELGRGVRGMIGHTQPRRLAARAVAERVASELGSEVGGAVGYTVRFTDEVGEGTYVKVMTDGILLAELQRDRMLTAYDTIIVDEAHERSLNIDFLLGYLTRLLPQRPDLKLVITSATIDTERFADHFDAPVVEVSGRSFPVEVRYRPFGQARGDDRDQVQATLDAIDELASEGSGDVLVFCSGEREIRDTADALRRRDLPRTEVLPLYARLSIAEQHKVFASHPGRRIVLATNVAETSLTVPGIRYVVDPGTARISRYNRRTKVQRLPIEPISQASAAQRAGRCGRVAPGICIRLYAEDAHDSRPEFTDPEILRTNLASVILQMAAAGLGDVAGFPFVDPPDARAVADGVALLVELGAVADPDGERPTRRGRRGRGGRRSPREEAGLELTTIGRRLARLPVDPRLGRMVLAAEEHGCVREVLVIAAALSIIDPRERPNPSTAPGAAAQAAEAHARFDHPQSDLLSLLALWDHLRTEQRERSSSAFRRMCRAEHLSWLRVREWQDVHRQLRRVAQSLGVTADRSPADPDAVHQALLAGLLSQVGMWDPERQDYEGARGARFTIARGSSLGKARPRWVMAAELVETDRLRARRVAAIDPRWLERAGAHLVRRTHGEPWWDRARGTAMVEERVTLVGLPVAQHRVPLGRVDPDHARTLLISHALVEGDWDGDHPFRARNADAVAAVEALEDKARHRDLLIDDDAIAELYDARLPEHVTTVRHLERWLRDHRQADPGPLDLTAEDLLDRRVERPDPADFPDTWPAGPHGPPLRLVYRFEPGHELDGVTAEVPLDVLGGFDGAGLDWQVPGHRHELVTTLVRALPKAVRRGLVPVPDRVREVLERVGPADGPLLEVLPLALSRLTGNPVPVGALDLGSVPDHLLVTYAAVDASGRRLAWSKDLAALAEHLAPRIRAAVAGAAPGLERTGLTAWPGGELPRRVETDLGGRPVVAHPALVDEGSTVGVRLLEDPEAQAAAMRAGTRRLLLLGLRAEIRDLRRSLLDATKLALAGSGGSVAELLAGVATATVDDLVERHGGPAWDEDGWAALQGAVRSGFAAAAASLAATAARVASEAAALDRRLEAVRAAPLQPAVADMRAQLARLVGPGFVTAAGARRLRHVERHVAGIAHRLDKLPGDVARDARRMAQVHALEDAYAPLRAHDPSGEVAWMLEELRVSLFAQHLGTDGPISDQRVVAALRRLPR
jgi:ATP-dependent helicase HrpA